MKIFDPKKKISVLRALQTIGKPLGGTKLARQLQAYGVNLRPRTLRLYLEQMEKSGLVETSGHKGRQITRRGLLELRKTTIINRVGLAAARMDALAYKTTYRLAPHKGFIVANASLIEESDLSRALRFMKPVFKARLGMGQYCAILKTGETCGETEVPPGKVGIATVCSVTLNGILLAAGIPVSSRFGGVLEMDEGRPAGFTDVIHYDGTSLDPLEVFIKGRLTSVYNAALAGRGRICASFREVPSAAVQEVERVVRRLNRNHLNGILMIGQPNQPLLDFPVHEGRTGMIVAGGLNPLAAAEESGVPVMNFAMRGLLDFSRFQMMEDLVPTK